MPSWNDLLDEFLATPEGQRPRWVTDRQNRALRDISTLSGGRHVLFHGSAFLQKPQAPPPLVQITPEDVNGFMSCIYGMNWSSGLTLVMYSPGGVTNAAETIVSYLRSKVTSIEVVIPAFAMSAATMISLAADKIVREDRVNSVQSIRNSWWDQFRCPRDPSWISLIGRRRKSSATPRQRISGRRCSAPLVQRICRRHIMRSTTVSVW